MRRRLIAVTALISLNLTMIPHTVYSCSCADLPAPEQALNEADEVFVGATEHFKVIGESAQWVGRDGRTYQAYPEGREATFRISRMWKGPRDVQRKIITGAGGGDCGFDFVVGKVYLVYVHDGKTHICTRTRHISLAQEDLAALGPGLAIEENVFAASSSNKP